jgi:hypothetical protein
MNNLFVWMYRVIIILLFLLSITNYCMHQLKEIDSLDSDHAHHIS